MSLYFFLYVNIIAIFIGYNNILINEAKGTSIYKGKSRYCEAFNY